MTLKVLTANRLADGVAVWLGAAGAWVEDIDRAFIARHDEAVIALEASGKIALDDNLVVDVNVIDVEEEGTGIRPVRLRERIRAEGPTVSYGAAANLAARRAAA